MNYAIGLSRAGPVAVITLPSRNEEISPHQDFEDLTNSYSIGMRHTMTNPSQWSQDDRHQAVQSYTDSVGRVPEQSDPSNEPSSSLEDPFRIDLNNQRKEILYHGTKLDMPLWLAQNLLLQ